METECSETFRYLQIVKEPIGGEAVKRAKAAKAPFPSNQRPRSIIANGGGDTVLLPMCSRNLG